MATDPSRGIRMVVLPAEIVFLGGGGGEGLNCDKRLGGGACKELGVGRRYLRGHICFDCGNYFSVLRQDTFNQ